MPQRRPRLVPPADPPPPEESPPPQPDIPEPPLTEPELIDRARRTLMQAVPAVTRALAENAEKGSLPHIKLLLELLGLDGGELSSEEVHPPEKTLEQILMENWAKEP